MFLMRSLLLGLAMLTALDAATAAPRTAASRTAAPRTAASRTAASRAVATRATPAPKKAAAFKPKAASTRAPQKAAKVAVPKRRVRVAGRVLDPDDRPVRGARVLVVSPDWFSDTGETFGETTTDENGVFSREIETVVYSLIGSNISSRSVAVAVVQANGFALGGNAVKVPEEEPKAAKNATIDALETVVKMRAARVVSGVLRDDKGKPASGVAIRAVYFYVPERRGANIINIPRELKEQFSARTDAKGAWRIEGLPDDAYVNVRLDDERYLPREVQLSPEGPVSGPGGGGLVAQRGGEIVGRVLGFDGKPATGVHIFALPEKGNLNYRNNHLPSGRDGTFRLARLAPGEYSLLVTGRKIGTLPKRAEDTPIAPAIENVRVGAGASTRVADMKLVRPAIIEGQVVDAENGKPLAKQITVNSYGPHWPRAMSRPYWSGSAGFSDAKGVFRIAVAPGDVRVFAAPDFSGPWEPDRAARGEKQYGVSLKLKSGERRRIALRFERGQSLRGSVRDESGRVVPSATLLVEQPNKGGRYYPLDKNGNFALDGLATGEYRVGMANHESETEWEVVGGNDGDFGDSRAVTVSLPQKEPLEIIVRARVFAQLQGRVLAASGEPLARVKLSFRVPIRADGAYSFITAISNSEGRFKLERLMPDLASQLAPSLQDATQKGYRLARGGEVSKTGATYTIADIVMEKLGGKAAGRVLADGQPVGGALAFAPESETTRATTDAAGRFALSELPSSGGVVMAAEGKRFGQSAVPASADSAAPDIEIALHEAPSLPPRDVARAALIAREVVGTPHNRHDIEPLVRRLSLLDPDAALQLAFKTGENPTDENAALGRVLAAITQRLERDPNAQAPRAIEWASARLDTLTDDEAFVSGASRLGLVLANSTANADRAADLFERALARQKKRAGTVQLESGALLATLAARLKRPEAGRLFDAVFVAASQPTAAGSWPAVAANVARGSAALARDALEQMPESQRTGALGGVIPFVAMHDLASARTMMAEFERRIKEETAAASTREAKNAVQWIFTRAAREMIRIVGPREPAWAAALARGVEDDWMGASTLALAARYQPREEALAMLREVANSENSGVMRMTMPMLAAQAAPLDRETAQDFLERAWKNVESSARHSGERHGVENYILALAPLDPARARMLLESEMAQQKTRIAKAAADKTDDAPIHGMTRKDTVAWQLSQLAAAMAPFDIERALEMARSIDDEKGGRSRALAQIAFYALGDEADRRRFAFAAETGFED